jgi:hypothetical protein
MSLHELEGGTVPRVVRTRDRDAPGGRYGRLDPDERAGAERLQRIGDARREDAARRDGDVFIASSGATTGRFL